MNKPSTMVCLRTHFVYILRRLPRYVNKITNQRRARFTTSNQHSNLLSHLGTSRNINRKNIRCTHCSDFLSTCLQKSLQKLRRKLARSQPPVPVSESTNGNGRKLTARTSTRCWSKFIPTLASAPRLCLSWTRSWTTSLSESALRPPVSLTTTSVAPSLPGRSKRPSAFCCLVNWPNTPFPKEPRLLPNTPAPSKGCVASLESQQPSSGLPNSQKNNFVFTSLCSVPKSYLGYFFTSFRKHLFSLQNEIIPSVADFFEIDMYE